MQEVSVPTQYSRYHCLLITVSGAYQRLILVGEIRDRLGNLYRLVFKFTAPPPMDNLYCNICQIPVFWAQLVMRDEVDGLAVQSQMCRGHIVALLWYPELARITLHQ